MTRSPDVLPLESGAVAAADSTTTQPLVSRLRRRHLELTAVAAMSLLYACSYFHRVGVPGTIFDELQNAFRLDAAGVTALASIYLYIYAFLQIPIGFLADRIGGRRLIIAGGALLVVGGVLFPLAQTTWQLYAARALVGLGASAMFLATVEQIDELFSARAFSYLIGPFTVTGLLGGLAGTLPFERAAHAFGWRGTMLGVGIFTAVALAAAVVFLRRLRPAVLPTGPITFEPARSVVANGRSWPLLIGGAITFTTYFVIQGVIGKKLLADHAGFTSAQAASATFAMMLVAMAVVGSSGLVSRLAGHRRKPPLVIGAILLMFTTGLGLVSLRLPEPGALLTVTYLMAAICSGVGPIYVCAIKEANRPDAVALSVGMGNTAAYVVVALLAHIVGLILDAHASAATMVGTTTVYPRSAYQMIFLLFAGLSVVVFICSLLARETRQS